MNGFDRSEMRARLKLETFGAQHMMAAKDTDVTRAFITSSLLASTVDV